MESSRHFEHHYCWSESRNYSTLDPQPVKSLSFYVFSMFQLNLTHLITAAVAVKWINSWNTLVTCSNFHQELQEFKTDWNLKVHFDNYWLIGHFISNYCPCFFSFDSGWCHFCSLILGRIHFGFSHFDNFLELKLIVNVLRIID